jgi:hypothetical protein
LRGSPRTAAAFPPDLQELLGLFVAENPLTTFVLSESLSAAGTVSVVDSLRTQNVPVLTYPLAVSLASPHRTAVGAFEFTVSGPPGIYAVLSSTNLTAWSVSANVTNLLGSSGFTDAISKPQKFYRALRFDALANMEFIPLDTFTMDSPTTNSIATSSNVRKLR